MKNVRSSELKNNIGMYLDYVIGGEEVMVYRHKRLIAKIVPVFDGIQENTILEENNDQNNQNIWFNGGFVMNFSSFLLTWMIIYAVIISFKTAKNGLDIGLNKQIIVQ